MYEQIDERRAFFPLGKALLSPEYSKGSSSSAPGRAILGAQQPVKDLCDDQGMDCAGASWWTTATSAKVCHRNCTKVALDEWCGNVLVVQGRVWVWKFVDCVSFRSAWVYVHVGYVMCRYQLVVWHLDPSGNVCCQVTGRSQRLRIAEQQLMVNFLDAPIILRYRTLGYLFTVMTFLTVMPIRLCEARLLVDWRNCLMMNSMTSCLNSFRWCQVTCNENCSAFKMVLVGLLALWPPWATCLLVTINIIQYNNCFW